MNPPTWKRWLILTFGLLENLVFSGSILGWSALNYMLKAEGIFSDVCIVTPPITVSPVANSTGLSDTLDSSYLVNNYINYSVIPELPALMINQTEQVNLVAIESCPAQDRLLNLAYTLGTFFNGFTAFIWGFLLDRWGLRTVRLIINFFLFTGSLLLCFTARESSYLAFPAIILLCLGGVPIRIANMQFANLFPSNRSTVITFYSGAFSASAVLFVLLKSAYDSGVTFATASSSLVFLSLLMIPVTFFLLPSDRVREPSDDDADETDSIKRIMDSEKGAKSIVASDITLKGYKDTSSPVFSKKSFGTLDINSSKEGAFDGPYVFRHGFDRSSDSFSSVTSLPVKQSIQEVDCVHNGTCFAVNKGFKSDETNDIVKTDLSPSIKPGLSSASISKSEASTVDSTVEVPFRQSLVSLAFTLHQWWYSWLITYMIMYVGTMNLWLDRVTDDIEVASNFSKIFGMVQVLALILAPMAGLVMDYQVNSAAKFSDPLVRKLKQIQSGIWPMLFTSATLAAILICRFFNTTTAVYTSIVFITLLRSFLVAVASAYLRIRFPASHFNKLLGIMSTSGAFVTLLQFPLFVWEAHHADNALWVNLLNCTLTLIAFLNPIHLMFSGLQRKFIARESNAFLNDQVTCKS